MRFYEFNKLKDFGALILIVKGGSRLVCKTSVSAADQQQARALLRKIFGNENVLSISEIKHMPPAAEQIQLEQLVAPPSTHRVNQAQKNTHVQNSQVSGRKRRVKQFRPPKAIPDQVKRRIVQKRLAAMMVRQGNLVTPTEDDLRIARDDAELQQKRADYEFRKPH